MLLLHLGVILAHTVLGSGYLLSGFSPRTNVIKSTESVRIELRKSESIENQISSSIPTEELISSFIASPMLTEINLKPKSNYTIYVNHLQDNQLGSCYNHSITCNLRSAIATCIDLFTISDHCDIYLPSNSAIFLNSSSYPPLEISLNLLLSSSFRLSIFGQGSSIKCIPEGNDNNNNCQHRFLSVSNLNEESEFFSFHLYNLTINGFGSTSIDGGALFLQGLNNTVINKVTFENNIGSNGGALYMTDSSHSHIDNCVFVSNYGSYGGVFISTHNYNIRFRNDIFLYNEASFGGGLSIGSFNMDIRLERIIFYMNKANTGGAILIDLINTDITMQSLLFSNNSAIAGNGGAIVINDYNTLVNINNTVFQGNRAVINGGAVCISAFNSELSFWRSSFIGNFAQDGGGMSFSTLSTNIILNSIIFENNKAENNGGALIINFKIVHLVMKDVHIRNNEAGSYGGGLFIGIKNNLISCERCIFHRNTAQIFGGGVYISQFNDELSFTNCIINENSARFSGGAFYINIRNNNIRINTVLFNLNIANNGDGGAIYAGEFNNVNISYSNMTMNTAITGSGSGLFSSKSNSVQIFRSNFISNVGSQLGTVTLSADHTNSVIRGCIFINNTATSGSAISVFNSRDIYLINCQFYGNYAISNGGSIHIDEVNRIVLRNLQMRNNIAGNNGGGICVIQTSDITLYNNYLYGNQASLQGGGLYVTKTVSLSITHCHFSESSSEFGSAIYMSYLTGDVTVQSCSFANNKAVAAGTVYWLTSDMMEPRGLNSSSIWTGNQASKYGPDYATNSDHCISPLQIFIDRNFESSSGGSSGSGSFLPAMKVIFYDYYYQIVQLENSDTVSVSIVDWTGCTPSPLKGSQNVVVVNGTAAFNSLSTSCTPEGNIYLKFTSSTHKLLSSVTVVHYPTFSPTSSPTSSPTTVPLVVMQQLIVTSDNSAIMSDSTTTGISIGGSFFLLIIVIAIAWRYILSPKAVKKREKLKRLENLPLHQLLVDYSPTAANNEKMSHMLETHPEYALEKDYDNKTALDIIFEDENSLGVSSDVIYILLLNSCQLIENGEHSMDNHDNVNVNGHSAWLEAAQRNDDATVIAVERILFKFRRNIRTLAHVCDGSGRSCKDIAGPRCKELILRKLYLYDRYEIKEGPPEHKSATSLVLIANDHGEFVENYRSNIRSTKTTSTITRVAMKFMCHRDQFLRETDARARGNFDEKFVLPIHSVYDGDSLTEENVNFREDTVIYGLTEYPYCIVMEAATQDLKRFIDHEQIIDMNIEEIKPIMRQLTCCLDHIHKKNFVHGDIKPLNVLQKGALLTLTDLDASCSIGNGVYAGSKTSSGYLPPELFWCNSINGEVKYNYMKGQELLYGLICPVPGVARGGLSATAPWSSSTSAAAF
eukprot:gene1553-3000_t